MDGVAAVRKALKDKASVTALVPATRIAAGVQPQGTPLPALSIQQVSGTVLGTLAKGMTRHRTERVQVTAMAADYPALKALLKALPAIDRETPVVAGITRAMIRYEGDGPDFMDEAASIFMGSRDFIVSYIETT